MPTPEVDIRHIEKQSSFPKIYPEGGKTHATFVLYFTIKTLSNMKKAILSVRKNTASSSHCLKKTRQTTIYLLLTNHDKLGNCTYSL